MRAPLRVPLSGLTRGDRRVEGDAAHYLSRVHRLAPGDAFTAFDPEARLEAGAEVLASERAGLLCRFTEPRPAQSVGDPGLTLIQCVAKGDKVDEVVRAATALGVSTLLIAESARAVARESHPPRRLERWRAVALDAARQSGRGDLPELAGPAPLSEMLAHPAISGALKLCLHPGAERAFAEALDSRAERPLALLVGPEGGFTPDELAAAKSAEFIDVRLGSLILRTELAGIAALGAVLAAREKD